MAAEPRIVPVDLANERVVIATMIHEPSTRRRLALELSDAELGDPRHQVIFRALCRMAKERLAWSEDTLSDLAAGEDFGGFKYLRQIVDEHEPNANLDYHLDRLRLDATKFKLIDGPVPALGQKLQDPRATRAELASALRAALAIVEQGVRSDFDYSGDRLADGYIDEMRARRALGDRVLRATGFPALDAALTFGLAPGLVSVVAARPRVGKTLWATRLVRQQVALRRGAFVCGWEMRPTDYLDSMVAAETGIPLTRIIKHAHELTDEERWAVFDATELITQGGLLTVQVNPFPHLLRPKDRWADVNERNLDLFESIVARGSERADLFVLDVVMKMLEDRRPDSVARALVRIKSIAQRYSVHVMMLHHINREGAEGRPSLEHLKGAGAIEEDMDLVLGLDRPALRVPPGRARRMRDVLDVHLLKQRQGIGSLCVRYAFDGAHARLLDESVIDGLELEREERGETDADAAA